MESLTKFSHLLDQSFAGISFGRMLLAGSVLFFALLLRNLFSQLLARFLVSITRRTAGEMDDMLVEQLKQPTSFLVLIGGLWLTTSVLALPTEPVNLAAGAYELLRLLFIINIGWFLFNLIGLLDMWLGHLTKKTESTLDDHLLPFIRKGLRCFIVVMMCLMLAQTLGYPISGVLASLGIGGLAVALAAKDSISNIFGSLMIILDRPFQIGDWVKAGDVEGTVEEIGFRSTRIRTFAKTLVTIPNSILTNLAIDNFSRMPKRRIKLSIGVSYATTPDQMRAAVENIRGLLRQHAAVDQDFSLVNFTDFGSSSLDILVYCFTRTTVWGEYLAARQDICLQIMDILETMGLEIAFPSRTLYLRSQKASTAAPAS
ncbi:mechanosensitive ion channel family protein [Geopsychrobacter electrodiphilus]|uniref:mechanosensitive ion channel family protein n=1 Tax=Geopsychrobacter electrodiphilus TaxID=225196 RepID=UPI000378EB83|nr:mechanosensitive ion channel family protein [Geopsychrobacter electrodiphilus]